MTREEYLSALKENITSLTDSEKNEALQYYSDYFEEANDDEKVMEELGSPEEVAKLIMEKFSNALKKNDEESDSNENESKDEGTPFSDECIWTFDAKKITNVQIELGACHAVLIPGKKWMIETRGIRKENFVCNEKNGKLVINNTRKMNFMDFFNHDRKSRLVPRILISVPETELENLQIKLGAGLIKSQELKLSSKKAFYSVGAGNMELEGLVSEASSLHCGMGNISYKGQLKGKTNVDCGMGNITLKLSDKEENFSFDCKVGMGEFKFNDKKVAGISQSLPENLKANHLSVNVGMGSVNCTTNN